ncbi:MAG: hypothetical protein ACO24H_03540 [Polynucleobacter sp.]
MKLPELYIHEVAMLVTGIEMQIKGTAAVYQRRMNAQRGRMLFKPWKKNEIMQEMLAESKAVLEYMNNMNALRDKLYESTGVDDDMQPITFKEILENS